MPELSKEVVALLTYLLPGFLVAWIFFALTTHQKPNQLERVIQALIFTLIVRALVIVEKHVLLALGTWINLGAWSEDSELIASVVSAVLLGFLVAWLTNTDKVHELLRRFKISQRSASPNEWCTVFGPREQFVVVELKDERRLYGWPKVWPSDPEKGHIFLTFASWLHGEKPVDLNEAEGVLISVKDVAHIEFVKAPEVP
jgi:hypothetical protein